MSLASMLKSEMNTHVCVERETHVLLECEPLLPVLIACDHASRCIPQNLGNLGVTDTDLQTHVAWDIGAGDVARALGAILGVPVVLGSNSRLVVDCNRNLDDPTAFPATSDGIAVPGNTSLGADERARRADAFYWPYHHAIRDQLRNLEQLAAAPAVIAVHSFTPEMDGVARPWQIGALWDKDPRIAVPFMEALANADSALVVGANEPYSGRHPADFTLDHHAENEGLPHLGIEVRQDLIDTEAKAGAWAKVLAAALIDILSTDDLYTHRAGQL
jgi:predicted N-formylglutamate amidohydrolase